MEIPINIIKCTVCVVCKMEFCVFGNSNYNSKIKLD